MNFLCTCRRLALVLLLSAATARAATVTWSTSTVSGPSDVLTSGTLVGAMNVGVNTAQNINGVAFAADTPASAGPLALGSATVTFSNLGNSFADFWFLSDPGGDAAYAAALDAGRWGTTGIGTITLGGLTVGQRYLVQLWIADTRATYETRVRTVDGVATTTGGPNIATGAFVANASTQVITVDDGAATFGPQVNMLQVRAVPTISWAASTVSGPADVNTTGTLVGAMNVGSAPADVATVNGVTFAADPAGTGPLALGSATVAFGNLGLSYGAFWTISNPGGSAPYGLALDSGRYESAGNGTVLLGGLVNGATYLVQIWIADTRSGANARVRTVDGVSTTSGGPNFLTGSFVASGASQLLMLADAGGFGPQVNMLQIRETARPVIMVTNTNNSGSGSLRQAILDANANTGADTIRFDAALAGQTITLAAGIAVADEALTTVDASALAEPVAISGDNATRLFRVLSGAKVLMRGLSLTAGDGTGTVLSGDGGTILLEAAELTMEDCVIRQCAITGSGGAIYAGAGGLLTLTRCRFEENASSTAGELGGAICTGAQTVISQCTFVGNSVPTTGGGSGGAIYAQGADLTISRCTFTGNEANSGGAVSCFGTGALAISQSTLTGNNAGTGAAVFCGGTGAATFTHVTITGNHAFASGVSGGGLRLNRALSMAYSVVSGNTSAGPAKDIENQGALTCVGVNMVQTAVNSGTATISGPAPLTAAPQLSPLEDHGGPTQTCPPVSVSPALNAAAGSTITTDQRGVAVSGTPDLGACEHTITIAALPDRTIDEDAGSSARTFQCTINSVSYTSPAPVLSAVSSNPALVTGITFTGTDPNRSLVVALAPNANGTATITVTVTRGTATATRSFLLTVTPVNDAPVFTKGADQGVLMNSTASVAGWATGIGDGDPEVSQTLSFVVSNNNSALFSVPPAIAANGTLTFTPAPWQTGSATVTVQLQDNGGAVSPNVNLSAAQTFTITVTTPTTLTVSNANDSGTGSLRDQIAAALGAGGSRRIVFGASLSGQTITLASEIVLNDPASADMLSIDASNLPAGLTINGGAGANRILSLAAGCRAALRGLTLTGGNGEGASGNDLGGAIYVEFAASLALTQCTLSGNQAVNGGAILNDRGTLTLTQCNFSGNSASNSAGAIHSVGSCTITQCTFSGNFANYVGAIYSQGTCVLTGCTLSTNTATTLAGAIYSDGAGSLTLSQCTLSDNRTLGSGSGGAIYKVGSGGATLSHCTLVGNAAGTTAPAAGGGIYHGGGALALANCIVSQNTALGSPDIHYASGSLTRQGVNLIGVNTSVTTQFPAPATAGQPNANGDYVGTGIGPVGAKVAPLANYGGPTQTRPPALGSPAIDAATGSTITTDQRGVAVGGVPDIGATEHIVPYISDMTALTVNEDSATAERTVAFTIGDAPGYTGTPSLTATSSNTTLVPTLTLGGSGTNRTVLLVVPADASGTAVITVSYGNGTVTVSDTFVFTVTAVNDPPTLDHIPNPAAILEDAAQQTIPFTGIGDVDTVAPIFTVTATSSDTALIPHPTVTYNTPWAGGSLFYTPVANAHGSATITVTVSHNGAADNTFSRTFTVTVTAVNDPPTFNPIGNQTISEDAGPQTVSLGGISAGPSESGQTLTVTATSSNTALIPHPTIAYTSPQATGTLTYTPAANASGSADITVTVTDGQATNNSYSRTFNVTVTAVNDPPTATNLSASETYTEDTQLNLTDIVITEVDGTAVTATLTLSDRDAGLLSTATSGAVTSTFAAGVWTASGALANVNALLAGVTFVPAANYNSNFTLSTSVSDGTTTLTGSKPITGTLVNDPPTLAAVPHQVLASNAGLQTVTLAGVGAGATNEVQTLVITATSSNTALIPHPDVTYTSPDPTGSLRFTPAAGQSGFALVTVSVSDGSATTIRKFYISVPVNPSSNVTHPGDSGLGSLRHAISTALAAPDSQSISFDPVLSGKTIVLASEIVIDDNASGETLTIDATNLPGGLTIDGGPGTNRILYLPDGDGAHLRGLTLTGGNSTGGTRSGSGGAILNSGTLTLTQCTLSGNSAVSDGGAIYNNSIISLTDCTLSGNSAQGIFGGAIYNSFYGTLALTHCTLSGNSVPGRGGAIAQLGGTLTLRNSLVAVNSASIGSDVYFSSGTLNRGGVNLIGNNSLVAAHFPAGSPNPNGDYVGTDLTPLDPLLAGLANNGGPTQTMRLLPGSPAINRITTPLYTTDQRGFPIVGLADIGAYENGAPTVTALADRVALSGIPTAPIAFALGDAETAATAITVTASSSSTNLVPNANVLFSGTSTNRTVAVTPVAGQAGTATITLTVNDGANTTSTNLLLTVLANTPYNTWKLAEFGNSAATPAIAGDTADGDLDRLNTFVEYATRGSPHALTPLPLGHPIPVSGPAWQMSFPYRHGDPQLRYIVQRNADLSNPAGWGEIYRYDFTAGAQHAAGVTSTLDSPAQRITLSDSAAGTTTYWRLLVEQVLPTGP